MGLVLIVILVLLLVGAFPGGPFPASANWGYFPSGAVGIILLVVLILLITHRI